MKRLIPTLIATLFAISAILPAYANGPTVIRGNKAIYKESGKTCLIKYDTSEMMIEEKSSEEYIKEHGGEPFRLELEGVFAESKEHFAEKWNKLVGDGLKMVTNSSANADYIMTIKFTSLNLGSAALAVTIGFGAGGSYFYGTVDVKNSSGEESLYVTVAKQTGRSKTKALKRMNSLMECFADDLLKVLKK